MTKNFDGNEQILPTSDEVGSICIVTSKVFNLVPSFCGRLWQYCDGQSR